MKKTRQQLKEEILREFRENEERKRKAIQELESDPLWQKMQNWENDGWKRLPENNSCTGLE